MSHYSISINNLCSLLKTLKTAFRRFHNENVLLVTYEEINEVLNGHCRQLSEWLPSAEIGAVKSISFSSISYFQFEVIKVHLAQSFPNLKINEDMNFTVILTKLPETEKSSTVDCTAAFNIIIGFTIIFKAMVEAKKPLVGHNFLTDLMIFYNQFHKPLPANYKTFKKELHNLFPDLYDTKHLVVKYRKELNMTNSGLSAVSELLTDVKSPFTPKYTLLEDFKRYEKGEFYHEAGYDAFVACKVFIKIAFYIASSKLSSKQLRPLTFKEVLLAMNDGRNFVNIIRADVHFISIDGEDPVSGRPQWLFVKMKDNVYSGGSDADLGGVVRPEMIADLFAPYGRTDVLVTSSDEALVAVENRFSSVHTVYGKLKSYVPTCGN
ncbi:Poly(A)-specific ribonuclease PNLDC1 [Nymphon striatum]|nr:Poly(A)-specific ribonuclease PNLDC1 [Nymphon striatum]